jgi:PKD repeat protein
MNDEEKYNLLKKIYSDDDNDVQSAIDYMEKMPASELDTLTKNLIKRGILEYTPDEDLKLTSKGRKFIDYWDDKTKSNFTLGAKENKLDNLQEKIQIWKNEGYNVVDLEQMIKSVVNPTPIKPKKEKKINLKILFISIFIIVIISMVAVSISISNTTSYTKNEKFVSEVENQSLSNAPPIASISASPTTGSAPLTISMTGKGIDNDGHVTSYHWDFGDGKTSDEKSPSHTYNNQGIYTATLTITDNNGSKDTSTMKISVQPKNNLPTAYASASPLSGTAPLSVRFSGSGSDTDGYISAYHWDFDDGSSSDSQNPSHIFTSPGEYSITLTVTDNSGETQEDIIKISVTQENHPPNIPTNENPNNQQSFINPDVGSLRCIVTDPDQDSIDVSFYWDGGELIGTANDISNNGIASVNINTLDRYETVEWYVIVSDGIDQILGPTWSFTVEAYDWDINRDAKVDDTDTEALKSHYLENGDPGWIREDINDDGVVNYLDVSIITSHYGESY